MPETRTSRPVGKRAGDARPLALCDLCLRHPEAAREDARPALIGRCPASGRAAQRKRADGHQQKRTPSMARESPGLHRGGLARVAVATTSDPASLSERPRGRPAISDVRPERPAPISGTNDGLEETRSQRSGNPPVIARQPRPRTFMSTADMPRSGTTLNSVRCRSSEECRGTEICGCLARFAGISGQISTVG